MNNNLVGIHELPTIFGLEMEYAGIDETSGLPVSNRGGHPLVEAFLHSISPQQKKELTALGGIKEEVFRHQREIVTKKGSLSDVLQRAFILHDLVAEHMKTTLGVLIADTSGPLPFPGGGVELITPQDHYTDSMKKVNTKGHILGLVTPKNYYLEAVEKIAATQPHDFAFARNASTSSTHLHMSYDYGKSDNAIKLARRHVGELVTTLIAKNSLDILENPKERRRNRGMSVERYTARSKIVATRAKLGEVLDPLDSILIHPGTIPNAEKFIANRYFSGENWNTTHAIKNNIHPQRDHSMVALKNPGGLTCELRSGDGPCNSKENLNTTVQFYMNLIHEVLFCY